MNVEQAIDTLRRAEPDLRSKGVLHAGLFGSLARGENGPSSDIDVLVDLDPNARLTVYDYVGIRDFIASLFDSPVDVVDREGLKPHLRQPVTRDLVNAF
jgi:predicted nucleotidyltransferase